MARAPACTSARAMLDRGARLGMSRSAVMICNTVAPASARGSTRAPCDLGGADRHRGVPTPLALAAACGETRPRIQPTERQRHEHYVMSDSCLKFLDVGTGPAARRIAVRAARGRGARPVLARRLQVRHEGHQGGGARRLGRRQGPRLHALRLFRPRRIRRRLRRRHDRPLAGGKRWRCSRALRRGRRSWSAPRWAAGWRCCWRASSSARTAPRRRRSPAWC